MLHTLHRWLYGTIWLYPGVPGQEDLNVAITKRTRRHNRRVRFERVRATLFAAPSPPATVLDIPKQRRWNWMIESCHFPEEYHAENVREYAPWCVAMRYLFVDLPEQLENPDTNLCLKSWRDHLVEDPKGVSYLRRPIYSRGHHYLKWGRRIVFSEQARDGRGTLTGRWLAAAYVWSDSREWLKNINVKTLVSFRNVWR